MTELAPNLYAIRGWLGCVHLLVDTNGVVLIDSGFVGDEQRVRRALGQLGRNAQDLRAILLTHGHLDHTRNARALQQWSGGVVWAPAGDEQHVAGTFPYRGWARVCGWLEAAGRRLLRYEPPRVDRWFRDGETLPYWGGLRVVGLPGHTRGHCGFYSATHRILYVGDLFAKYVRVAVPPRILNVDHAQAHRSLSRVLEFDVDWIVPCHYWRLDRTVVERIRAKARRQAQRAGQ